MNRSMNRNYKTRNESNFKSLTDVNPISPIRNDGEKKE
jgi:hypothetical protein